MDDQQHVEPTQHVEPSPGLTAVYVPSERVRPGDAEALLVLRQIPGGPLVVPAYSSLPTLVRCCGEAQPWVSLPTDSLPELLSGTGADFVVLDVPLTAAEPPLARTSQGQTGTSWVPRF